MYSPDYKCAPARRDDQWMLTNPDQTALINMSFIVSVGKVDHVFVNPRGMTHALFLRDFTDSAICDIPEKIFTSN